MNNIKIYTTDWCPACVVAKKVLDENGYSYTEINIEQEGITRKQLKLIKTRPGESKKEKHRLVVKIEKAYKESNGIKDK